MCRAALLAIVCMGVLLSAPLCARADDGGVDVVYRLYYAPTLDHHYTMDANEYHTLGSSGWLQEGVAWRSGDSAGTPVYRLYHEGTKDHHYTMDANEYRVLGTRGWTREGIAWYSAPESGRPVYRLYYEPTKDHHYTMDANEYRVLGTRGWAQEGVAWYSAVEGADSTLPNSSTPIMGTSQASAERLAAYYRNMVGEDTYPSNVYFELGAPTLMDFCDIVVEEAEVEGVRAEVIFAQAMKETGWLRFSGAVKVEQCNFCGLGAVNSAPASAATFASVREGLRAQVQHLKAYASTDSLVNACVDPRFNLVQRGIAPTLEDLNGRWAVPGTGYGESIAKMIDSMMAIEL